VYAASLPQFKPPAVKKFMVAFTPEQLNRAIKKEELKEATREITIGFFFLAILILIIYGK